MNGYNLIGLGAVMCALVIFAWKAWETGQASRGKTTLSVDPGSLQPGPILNELSHEQLSRLQAVHAALAEVDPAPFPEWVDEFRRDRHPDAEIAIYEAIAAAYRAFCEGRTLSPGARRELYGLLLLRSMQSEEAVLTGFEPQHLGRDDAVAALRHYRAAPSPIVVIQN